MGMHDDQFVVFRPMVAGTAKFWQRCAEGAGHQSHKKPRGAD